MYKKSSTGWLKHLDFMVLDIICLQLAFVMGYFLRHHSFKPYGSPIYRNEAIVFALIQLMIMFFDDSFKNVMKRGYLVEIGMTVKNMVYIIVLGVFYLFLIQEGDQFSRATIMLTGALYGMLSYLMRIGWKAVVKKRSSGEHSGRSLLIITTEKQSQSVVKSMLDFDYIGVRPTGVVLVDQDRTGHKIHGVPVVSNLADAAEYVCREWFDEVLIVLPEGREIPQKVFDAFAEMGITIHVKIADVNEMQGKNQTVERMGNYTVVTTCINMASAGQLVLKRIMDICGGLAGCILTGIIFLFVAPAIYIKSPGPIFFSQYRVGKNGRKFKIYKFRSMYMDAEARKAELMKENKLGDGKMFKMDFDPRVIGNKVLPDGSHKTGVGDFIRRTSLDEFPQFYNVLKGDMSLVGPRPALPEEVARYGSLYSARLLVKPGITGPWQVSGRSDLSQEQSEYLDVSYIENWSIVGDLAILAKTVMVIFTGRGSY
mgnify:CR=1 FL=1